MLCRLNLCRTIWVEKQLFSSSYIRIMLKYLVCHTFSYLHMIFVLCRYEKRKDTSWRCPLWLSRVFLLNLVSYNFSFSVFLQGTKMETSVSWIIKSSPSQLRISKVSFLSSSNSLISPYCERWEVMLPLLSTFFCLKYRIGFLVLLKFSYWCNQR